MRSTKSERKRTRRLPDKSWTEPLTPQQRTAAEDMQRKLGIEGVEAVVAAYEAATRKPGAPSLLEERTPWLQEVADLLVQNPKWSLHAAAQRIAQKHATAPGLVEGLRRWLSVNFPKQRSELMSAAKSRSEAAKAQIARAQRARNTARLFDAGFGYGPVGIGGIGPTLATAEATRQAHIAQAMTEFVNSNAAERACTAGKLLEVINADASRRSALDTLSRGGIFGSGLFTPASQILAEPSALDRLADAGVLSEVERSMRLQRGE